MTEIDPANLSLFYLISRQIGNMLRMYQMSREQKKMQQKLETLVREIEEKNEVLNFLSESDALTGCLNRRGFMEKCSTDEPGVRGERGCNSFCRSGSPERD